MGLILGLTASQAYAISEEDLLPVDEAYVFSTGLNAEGLHELRWQIADGYYLYRHRFDLKPADPSSFELQAFELPNGEPKTDEFFGDTEIYRQAVSGIVRGRALRDGEIEFRLRYQGCADIGICYPPVTRVVSLAMTAGLPSASGAGLPGNTAAPIGLPLANAQKPIIGGPTIKIAPLEEQLPLPAEQAFQAEAIADSADSLLVRFTPAPGYYLYRDRTRFELADNPAAKLIGPRWPPSKPHFDEHFGDVQVYFEQVEVPVALRRIGLAASKLELTVEFQGCQTDGICYPPMKRQISVSLPAAATLSAADETAPDSASIGFALALLLALGGGLILNLMPCVLPVLSLKVLGLAGSGESASKARAHALWYTAGVLVSFALVGMAALALRSAGLALGWGFQLQQPWLVATLALIMMAVGLSLSGVFQFGAGLAGVGQSLTEKKGAAGDFFTGVLAVVVATPCTAPFMGSALAYAFTAPMAVALGVFLALGLGLALPFLLIGFVPALARMLPRPGAWMDTFKQALAFPMYLTAAWLIWVLIKQRGADAGGWILIASVLLAAAAWAWNHWQIRRHAWAITLTVLGLGSAIASVAMIHQLPTLTKAASSSSDGSVAYSADLLAKLRSEGKPVFVNMTADWCVTCKANEKAVLSRDSFKQALADSGAVYMKGDWTDVDPAITAFLDQHGAVGVPLYVVFPADGAAGAKLPTVLTSELVVEALRDAKR
ncbi:protein-disulfide reductase DsbD [Pseudoxanthomonas sp. CAU 1598]|uniref:Protein-disulfide reductase DsbD n=2 Tax=Pseudomarimonas arenosa TaxID=2774145 RepID=A0AAW3ZSK4_9GAMM|nr:protein-disulfide reductase DsbD [Pseudomarimonas arenosa]